MLPVTRPSVEYGTVAVAGSRIAYVGKRSEAPSGQDVDLGNSVLLPGLVNAHTHLELTAFRGLLDNLPFPEWIVRLQAAKVAVMTEESFLDSARLGIREGLSAGVTTYGDSCDSGVALRAMHELGVRGVMYQEVFGPSPSLCAESMTALRSRISSARQNADNLRVLGVSPHAPYTVSDALFTAVARFAEDERLPVAVHIAESEAESRYVTQGEGPFAEAHLRRGIPVAPRARSPVELLVKVGVLDLRPLLVHAVRIDRDDIDSIVGAGCSIAHCPVSNTKLGHGIAPLLEILDAGIKVGLGSDSMASNDRMDMLEEARVAALLQRTRSLQSNQLSAKRLLELVTIDAAYALGVSQHTGSLEEGKDADLAAFAIGEQADAPVYEPEAAIVLAMTGEPARMVVVAGEMRVRDGRVLGADEEVGERVAEIAKRLSRMGNRE